MREAKVRTKLKRGLPGRSFEMVREGVIMLAKGENVSFSSLWIVKKTASKWRFFYRSFIEKARDGNETLVEKSRK